jgi:acyl carrier protein
MGKGASRLQKISGGGDDLEQIEELKKKFPTCEDVRKRVKLVVSKYLSIDIDTIKENDSFVELGADSLDLVEISMAFEMETFLDIPDIDAEKLQTIKDSIQYVCKRIGIEYTEPSSEQKQLYGGANVKSTVQQYKEIRRHL